jgi:hypothetical protein
LLLIAADDPAPSSLTAEEALSAWRDATTRVPRQRCAPATGDEITVCARPDPVADRQRLPLPDERGPRAGARTAIGEAQHDPGPPCNIRGCGGIDLVKLGQVLGAAVEAAIGDE